jgi:hypothetical protein
LNVTDAIIHFIGDGSALSHLNASNVDFGTLSTSVFPASGVTAGTYGSSSNVSQVTIDQYGRVTAAANIAVVSSQWTGLPGSSIYYIPGVSIGSSNNATANLQVTGNVYVSNSVTTTNVYATNYYGDGGLLSNVASQWSGTKGFPIYYIQGVSVGSSVSATANLQVTGNVYVSNAVTVPNVHVTDTIDVTGALTANAANATFFFDTFTIPYINTQYLNVSANTTLTGNLVVATANIATLNVGYLTVNSAVVYGATTLNVYGVSNLTNVTASNLYVSNAVTTTNIFAVTETLTGTSGKTTLNITGNLYASNAVTTTNVWAQYAYISGLSGSNVFLFSNVSGGSNVFGMDSNAVVVIGIPPSSNANYGSGYTRIAKSRLIINSNGTTTYPISLSLLGGYNTGIDFGGGGQGCVQIVQSSLGGGSGALGFNFNNSNGADGNIIERMRMSYNGLSILTGATPTATLDILGNTYISNALTTTNVFAATETLTGTTGATTLNVTGNVYSSNAMTTTNVFAITATVPGFTSQFTVNGGGTVTFSAAGYLLWSGRVMVIPAWRNAAYAAAGYWEINCPTSGTIIFNGGTVTCTAAGIPLLGWYALYYRVVPGTGSTSVQANFLIRDYTDTTYSPDSNWILLAVRNGDSSELKWMPGNTTIPVGGTFYTPSASYDKVQIAGTVVVDSTRSSSFLNVFSSNSITTTNVFANTSTLTGTTGVTTLNVTGNLYASNAVTTTNLYTAGITSNAVSTVFNFDTLTIPFVSCTTLNVASTSNLDTVTLTGEPGLTTLFASGNIYASNAVTTTNVFASGIILASSTLGTVVAGQMEYNTYLYGTINTTSGRGSVPIDYIYRLTTPTAAYGIASNNFFTGTNTGTGARLNLEASSVYDIEAHCLFTKTTDGTVTWILATSSAPTLITAAYTASPTAGISDGAPVTSYVGGVTTTVTFQTTGTLTGGVTHSFLFKIQVLTNLATTFGITATQSAGTMTSLAGSYYRVTKLSTTTGAFT